MSSLLGDLMPVEVRCQACAGGHCPFLCPGGIVEYLADSRGEPGDVARLEGHPRHPVDDGFAQSACGGRDQRSAGRRRFEGDDPERLVARRQDDGVRSVQPAEQFRVIEVAEKVHRPRDAMRACLLVEPGELGAFARDREGRAGVATTDSGECRDGVLHTLLVFQAADEEEFRRP